MKNTYFQISQEELGADAKVPILKLGDSGEVFYEMALEMISCIKEHNKQEEKTVFICPVGPVGQYPIFVRLVNREQIDLTKVWFINMDEYLTDEDEWIDQSEALSFLGFMQREVYDKIDAHLLMPENQRIFPDPKNPSYITDLVEELGGVDIAFGGIGINGHLAFNEPQKELSVEEFSNLTTRALDISRETRTINSVGDLNGAIDAMPKRCATIGMKEILSARKIVLGVFRDWHRAVIRQTAYGEVTTTFPATLLQNHPNALIITNENAAKQPF